MKHGTKQKRISKETWEHIKRRYEAGEMLTEISADTKASVSNIMHTAKNKGWVKPEKRSPNATEQRKDDAEKGKLALTRKLKVEDARKAAFDQLKEEARKAAKQMLENRTVVIEGVNDLPSSPPKHPEQESIDHYRRVAIDALKEAVLEGLQTVEVPKTWPNLKIAHAMLWQVLELDKTGSGGKGGPVFAGPSVHLHQHHG